MTEIGKEAVARYRVPPEIDRFDLSSVDPHEKALASDRDTAAAATAADIAAIDALQDVLYAEARRSVLVVFQAMDTGGKDGVIRKVFGPIDPLGVTATSFKQPNAQELAHDYLWRAHKAIPARGIIGIFNRSHYEDVTVVRVRALAPRSAIEQRYQQINDFERHLVENDVQILKIFLHISKEEQKTRLQARLDNPEKVWKFDEGDLAERARWDDYMEAYALALGRCSTSWAPWFVVPADRKWYRNRIVAALVRQLLERLDLRYPQPSFDPKNLQIV